MGMTRQEVYVARQMACVPEEIFEAYLAQCNADNKMPSARGVLRAGGLENVISEDIFEGTIFGDLAEKILKRAELIAQDMNGKQRRCFMKALHSRLKVINALADLEE